MSERPKRLLTQNSELREIDVWNWSIPAWVVELSDGTKFNACPSAGACAKLCYARWLYSMGGREDHLIDVSVDRHADVFPDEEAIEAAGYESQEDSDLYAVTLATTRVGIPANNIPHFRKKQGDATFGSLQRGRHSLPLAR